MFIEEITNSTKYPDVYIVPVEAGLRYMQAPMDKETIAALGKKDTSPFGCEAIEAQSGKYAANPCGSGQLCGPYDVVLPEDNINHEQRLVAGSRRRHPLISIEDTTLHGLLNMLVVLVSPPHQLCAGT